ncbi:MAG TPA: hypothetical protein VNF68_12075 [Candidatus Baltobacteraceae bacterium]|nr:hypothetical protein [Candidatus Baltobacteraceae bacterium]
MPLLAAVIDMAVQYGQGFFTDAVGGLGNGLFAMIVQIVYLFAFGIATIQANNIARGYKATFDDAWEEGRRKAGGILLAAVGFQFMTQVAAYIGSILGLGFIAIVLELAAYFFLIYTIPAASIGGLPGGLALSGSIRAVRSNVVASVILAVAFVALFVYLPNFVVINLGAQLGVLGSSLALAGMRALVLAYLAFPFASTYDDIAFKLY